MVNLVKVDPTLVGTAARHSRRGRVSYPIIKQFLEMEYPVVKLDPSSIDKNPAYLRAVLAAYVKSHDLPVKIFAYEGDLHLLRLDMDDDGKVDPDWTPEKEVATEGAGGHERDLEPVAINAAEVASRAKDEAKRSTK